MLVDGVTKLDKVNYGEAAQAETVRKMVVAMARDIRVLLIKLADRLHNVRTWRYVSRRVGSSARPARRSRSTRRSRTGSASRPSSGSSRTSRSRRSTRRSTTRSRASSASARRSARSTSPASATQSTSDLTAAKIKADGHRPAEALLLDLPEDDRARPRVRRDLRPRRLRVLVDTVRDCYAALGAIHARWTPLPGRFKDYIAMPKSNMYQSLHTTVIGPQGKPIEIQIRTHEMHRRAEYGVAAHWKYKEQRRRRQGAGDSGAADDMAWLAPAARLAERDRGPGRVPRLAALRDRRRSEVYVFTPKGEVSRCPPARTPVDFAYAVHTEVGHRTASARASTAGSCRSSRRSRTATSSRCSPPRPTAPGRRATGSSSSRAPGRATRSSSGSPRSAARRPSSRARTRSPRRCASRTCRCSG